jgi:hypothetical protein
MLTRVYCTLTTLLATNIAETSVTVPGVRFVVDTGYVKQKVQYTLYVFMLQSAGL